MKKKLLEGRLEYQYSACHKIVGYEGPYSARKIHAKITIQLKETNVKTCIHLIKRNSNVYQTFIATFLRRWYLFAKLQCTQTTEKQKRNGTYGLFYDNITMIDNQDNRGMNYNSFEEATEVTVFVLCIHSTGLPDYHVHLICPPDLHGFPVPTLILKD